MSTAETPFRLEADGRLSPWGDIAVMHAIGIGILFVAAFFNLVSLNLDKGTVELDGPVYLKLAIIAVAGMYGAWSLTSDVRVQSAAFSLPAAWIPILFGCYVVSSLFSTEPKNALVSSASILCVYLMTIGWSYL